MQALTWQGRENVAVTEVPDPIIKEPTDAIIKVTSTAICGSDLHLYSMLSPFLSEGDVLGHETMGIVQEVGSEVTHISPGDRVVVPFTISCGHCWMCDRGLFSQCETTQNREHDCGASLFGYTSLYGQVPGGQAEYLRVPHADFGPVAVPSEGPDDRWLFLSDVLPTAWQGVVYADVPPGGALAVVGLGPIGQFCVRVARHMGIETVIGVDRVPERLELAARSGALVIDESRIDDVPQAVRELTAGRGADGVIDAVGMEAHGSPVSAAMQKMTGVLPDVMGRAVMQRAGVDRLAALHDAALSARRGGTVSLVGVYGGAADPMNLLKMFDRQLTLRMGQANVRQWTGEILDVLREPGDVLGTETFATHHLSLDEAPGAYEMFQKKQDGCIKVVLHPGT